MACSRSTHRGKLVFVAFTEIRRSLGRFSLLISAVALLVLLLLFFQAVAGTLTSGLTGGLKSTSADVVVYDAQGRRNPLVSILSTSALDDVRNADGVVAAAPIGLGVFVGSFEGADLDMALVGIDPTGPSVPSTLSSGRLPAASGEALFSGSSFDDPVEIGERITVEGVTFVVVGTAPDAAFNVLPTWYVLFDDYVSVSQARAGAPIEVAPSMIGVQVADGADAGAVAQSLTASVDGIEALDRATAVDALPGVGQITQSFSILYLLLYIVVTIVTGVFFLILTVQKRTALVLFRAMGASSRDLVTMVLIQVVVVVGLGAVVGSSVTAGLLSLTSDTFGASLGAATTATTIAAIVALGLLASTGALRRVLAIDPVEATMNPGI
jgi:putative ABC transport system permease protein